MASIIVIGDVMLDCWSYLHREPRANPENAAVPIVRELKRHTRPGGAANLAVQLSRLGHDISLVGEVGDDDAGRQLKYLVQRQGIAWCVATKEGPTTVKQRLLLDGTMTCRWDSDRSKIESPSLLPFRIHGADAIVFSDYGKGAVMDHDLIRARSISEILAVNARRELPSLALANLITCNLTEARRWLPDLHPDTAEIENGLPVAMELAGKIGVGADADVVVTLADRGAHWCHGSLEAGNIRSDVCPAPDVVAVDVTGAGDMFLALMVDARLQGMPIDLAVRRAVNACTAAVSRPGPCDLEQEG